MPFTLVAETPRLRESGGALRVGESMVTLETILWAFLQGSTPEDIADQHPTLQLADVYDVIAYFLRHRAEIDRYLSERATAYEAASDALKAEFPPRITSREQLLRRRS